MSFAISTFVPTGLSSNFSHTLLLIVVYVDAWFHVGAIFGHFMSIGNEIQQLYRLQITCPFHNIIVSLTEFKEIYLYNC